jgi:hypothetical protein
MADSDNPDWSALFDVSGLLNTEAGAAPSSGAMPFMITKAQRGRLRGLGYSDEAISIMTPAEAHLILQSS